MTEYTNGYFKMMEDVITGYQNARTQRQEERAKLTEPEEIEAWKAREAHFKFPFSNGYIEAFIAWRNTVFSHSSAFEVNNLHWKNEVHDFTTCLKEAGIEEFVITDKSTGLMEALHALDAECWKINGLCKITRVNSWTENGIESLDGISMRINK